MQLPRYLQLVHRDLLDVLQGCESETEIQLEWLRTRLKQAAPQALVVV